jgi:hypothetical protein
MLFLEIDWHGVCIEVAAHALGGSDEAGPDVEDIRIGAQSFGLDLGCVGELVDVGRDTGLKQGRGSKVVTLMAAADAGRCRAA